MSGRSLSQFARLRRRNLASLIRVFAGGVTFGVLSWGGIAGISLPYAHAQATATTQSGDTPTLAPAESSAESASEPSADASRDAVSAESASDTKSGSDQSDDSLDLKMNFNGTPWKEVLEWFSEETGMSLQRDTWPTGTFSYVDRRRSYDVSRAMDAMNLVLMREGYALIRRGQQLILVDLEDDYSRDYLRELAEPISADELDNRANSDYVRVAFPLGGLDPEQVVKDLENLRSPSGAVQVLGSSRVILATDTVGILKSIRDILLASDAGDGGVLEYQLQNRAAEDVLEIARPHVGLDEGQNKGEDISVSTNFMGDRIYATGDPVKLRLLKGLIEKSDRPLPTADEVSSQSLETPTLKAYDVGTVDPTVAYEVGSRLLAGQDVRLTQDPRTESLILMGRAADHRAIEEMLATLNGGQTQGFEVIQLRRIDPQAALLTINKYFGRTTENPVGPTVDGDPDTKKLWVKGSAAEIEEVKRLISELEGGSGGGLLGDRVRILPHSGRTAEELLSQVQSYWSMTGRENRIRIMSSQDLRGRSSLPERRLNQPAEEQQPEIPEGYQRRLIPFGAPRQQPAPAQDSQPAGEQQPVAAGQPDDRSASFAFDSGVQLVSFWAPDDAAETQPPSSDSPSDESGEGTADVAGAQQNSPASNGVQDETGDSQVEDPGDQMLKALGKPPADIIIQVTPQGLIVASDDPEALNDFEELMATLADQMAVGDEQPTVYWLKYIKADVAAELLNNILSGSSSSGSSGGGGLLNEIGGGMLGGLMGLGGMGGGGGDSGPVLTTTGTVSIVSDSRLNALIIQANATDLRLVEDLLLVIDREESPEDVRTTPKPQLIPVIYQDANEVANIVKGVYSDRMAGQNGGQNRQPSPEDFINALRGRGGRGGNNQNENNKPTPISIAVDTRSNALIVSAPPQDFLDIRELVETIDQEGMESQTELEVYKVPGTMNAQALATGLTAILGAQARTGGTSNSTSGSNNSGNSGSSQASPSDIQQRIDMFRRMREAGGGSTGGRGGFPSFGGGSFGGFGGGTGGFGGTRGGFGGTRGGNTGGRGR